MEQLLDPVQRDDLVRAMLDELPGLLDDFDSDTRVVLLTLARMWTTLGTGEIRSKGAAADWSLERIPPEQRHVLEVARSAYRGEASENWDEMLSDARAFAVFVERENP